jgi:hypothetical protein
MVKLDADHSDRRSRGGLIASLPSGACVAIVASENDGTHYMQTRQLNRDWQANIVLVVDRRGAAFTESDFIFLIGDNHD